MPDPILTDDAGEPIKGQPRVGGAPISGGGGGGPGGTFGFGGGGGGLLSGSASVRPDLGQLRAMLRKRYVGAGTPGFATPPAPVSTAAAPAPTGAPVSVGGLQSFQQPGQSDFTFNRPGGGWGSPLPGMPPVPGGSTVPPGPVAATPPPTPGSTAGGPPSGGDNPMAGQDYYNGLVPGSVDFGTHFLGTLSGLLRSFLGHGDLGPVPSSPIMEGVRANALADAGAARSHNELLAESLGADPATAASSALQASLGSQGDVAKAVSGAGLGELQHQRDFGQNLLMALLTGQGKQNQYNPNQTPWGSIIQAIAGMGKP